MRRKGKSLPDQASQRLHGRHPTKRYLLSIQKQTPTPQISKNVHGVGHPIVQEIMNKEFYPPPPTVQKEFQKIVCKETNQKVFANNGTNRES